MGFPRQQVGVGGADPGCGRGSFFWAVANGLMRMAGIGNDVVRAKNSACGGIGDVTKDRD